MTDKEKLRDALKASNHELLAFTRFLDHINQTKGTWFIGPAFRALRQVRANEEILNGLSH